MSITNTLVASRWFSRRAHGGALLCAGLLVWFAMNPVQAATISLLCGVAASWPTESCRAASARFEAATGHQVRVIEAPADPSETLELLSELFAVESDAIDVVQLDIIWPGILASHLQDLGAEGRKLAGVQVAAARSAGTVGSSVVALPLFVDVGALFYRRDLLEAYGESEPVTWMDLRRSAGRILGGEREAGGRLDGYLFQGRLTKA